MGGIIMNENLDLTKILDGCPKGTKLYSTLQGEVDFVRINIFDSHPIVVSVHKKHTDTTKCDFYAKDGRYNNLYDGECILFPSKIQRDWSKFERFWYKSKIERFDPKTLQPFDKVLARDNPNDLWNIELFSHKEEGRNLVKGLQYNWCWVIPYNDDTKHLVGTNNDCPKYYKWWEE